MSACKCRHCKPQPDTTASTQQPAVHEPVVLPTAPRPFRVHLHERRPMDCTLHPDGQVTTVMNGEIWRSALSFDEMRAMDWADARIEWDPAPAADVDEPEPGGPEPVQPQLAA